MDKERKDEDVDEGGRVAKSRSLVFAPSMSNGFAVQGMYVGIL